MKELEARQQGIVLIDIRVPNMDQPVAGKARLGLLKEVFVADEIHLDPRLFPQATLFEQRPVRGASHDMPPSLRFADHLQGDRAGRVTEFHRPVDIETHKCHRIRTVP